MLEALHRRWGKNVKQARLEQRWKQQALAEACGFSATGLANIEAGRRAPSDETKLLLAGALRRMVEELFPWGDELPPFPQRFNGPKRTWSRSACGHRVRHLTTEEPPECAQCRAKARAQRKAAA